MSLLRLLDSRLCLSLTLFKKVNILARKKFKQVLRIRIEMTMTFRPDFFPAYCSFGMFKI
jgi:hypothetical protein